jgi:hypothetical protein
MMGWNEPDVYNNPEKFDLEIVYVAEEEDLCYEFNMFVVWQDANGALYYATDAGCSCPSPFETYTSLAELTPGSKADIMAELEAWSGVSEDDKIGLRSALDRV